MNNLFFLKNSKSNQNDLNSLVFRFRIKPTKKLKVKGLGITIPTKDWNQSGQRIRKSNTQHTRFNNILQVIENHIAEIGLKKVTPEDIDKIIEGAKTGKEVVSKFHLLQIIDIRMNMMRQDSTTKPQTLNTYLRTRKVLGKFTKDTCINIDINSNLHANIQHFINFCRNSNYAEGTIRLFLNNIKASIKYFCKINSIVIPIPSIGDYNWFKEEKEKIYLTKSELRAFYDFAMNTEDNKWGHIYRNDIHIRYLLLFLFRCFTGMRISDCDKKNCNEENIDPFSNLGYSFKYFSYKEEKMVHIPLLGDSYAYCIAKELRFDFPEKVDQNSVNLEKRIINQYYDALIEEADRRKVTRTTKNGIEKININGLITSHVARRTFARTIYDHKKDIYFVSRLLGHSDITVTQRYLDLNLDDQYKDYTDFKLH